MRLYLPQAVLFMALSLGTLVGLDRAVDGATRSPAESRYQAMMSGQERFEKIAIGTSHGEYGLDSHYLEGPGGRYYNFCAGSGGPGYFTQWYRIYRRYQPAPKAILISVDWFMFKGLEAKRPIETDSEFLPLGVLWELAKQPSTSLSVLVRNRFPLVKEQTRLASRLLGDRPTIEVQMDRYYRGYAPLKKKPFKQDSWVFKVPDHPTGVPAFEALLDTFARDGARVVFVQTPEYLPQSGEHPENQTLQGIADRRKIPFLNYNGSLRGDLNTDIESFVDWGHLNEEGAQKFGERLNRDLRALGAL